MKYTVLLSVLLLLICPSRGIPQTISIQEDIPFGEVIDHKGNPLELLLDLYLPSEDVEPNGKIIVGLIASFLNKSKPTLR